MRSGDRGKERRTTTSEHGFYYEDDVWVKKEEKSEEEEVGNSERQRLMEGGGREGNKRISVYENSLTAGASSSKEERTIPIIRTEVVDKIEVYEEEIERGTKDNRDQRQRNVSFANKSNDEYDSGPSRGIRKQGTTWASNSRALMMKRICLCENGQGRLGRCLGIAILVGMVLLLLVIVLVMASNTESSTTNITRIDKESKQPLIMVRRVFESGDGTCEPF